MRRARPSSPDILAKSAVQLQERTTKVPPPGLVSHPMITLEVPVPPVSVPPTPIVDRQAFLTPEDSVLFGDPRADLAAIIEEVQDNLDDLDDTLVIEGSITFPTNWVEGLFLMLQTDFLGMDFDQINQPAVEFGPFPVPRWIVTPGGSLTIFIFFLALYMHLL